MTKHLKNRIEVPVDFYSPVGSFSKNSFIISKAIKDGSSCGAIVYDKSSYTIYWKLEFKIEKHKK